MTENALGTFTINVTGMHCTACEQRIIKSLSGLDDVIDVKADSASGTVRYRIESSEEEKINARIIEVLASNGYQISRLPAASGLSPVTLGIILIFIIAGTVLLGRSGILNRIPVVETGMALSAVFAAGLLTSLHCVGMCGGLCISGSLVTGTSRRILGPLLYNLGRLISYTGIGFLAGALGSVISPSPKVQGLIILAAAVLMILYALKMAGIIRLSFNLPGIDTSRLKGRGPLIVGILNGFIPCGPLQAVQLFALGTGKPWMGAVAMALFCIGTMPLLFSFGALGNLISGSWKRRVFQIGAMVVLVMGAGMGIRGWRLAGLPLPGPTAVIVADVEQEGTGIATATIGNDGIQRIQTDISPYSYEQFMVQAGVLLEWTILVEEGDLNGCNNPITFPGTDVMIPLEIGENRVSFTPSGEGQITYMCWMGMITSTIQVVEDLNETSG